MVTGLTELLVPTNVLFLVTFIVGYASHRGLDNVDYLHRANLVDREFRCQNTSIATPWSTLVTPRTLDRDSNDVMVSGAVVCVLSGIITLIFNCELATRSVYYPILTVWMYQVYRYHVDGSYEMTQKLTGYGLILFFTVYENISNGLLLSGRLSGRSVERTATAAAIVALWFAGVYGADFNETTYQITSVILLAITGFLTIMLQYGNYDTTQVTSLNRYVTCLFTFIIGLTVIALYYTSKLALEYTTCSGNIDAYRKYEMVQSLYYYCFSVLMIIIIYVASGNVVTVPWAKYAKLSNGSVDVSSEMSQLFTGNVDKITAVILNGMMGVILIATAPSRAEIASERPTISYTLDKTEPQIMLILITTLVGLMVVLYGIKRLKRD